MEQKEESYFERYSALKGLETKIDDANVFQGDRYFEPDLALKAFHKILRDFS